MRTKEKKLEKNLWHVMPKISFIEVIKQAEDKKGMIIRMYENRNRHTKTKITLPDFITQMYECNLLERNEREIEVNAHVVEVTLKPYEIKTYRIV